MEKEFVNELINEILCKYCIDKDEIKNKERYINEFLNTLDIEDSLFLVDQATGLCKKLIDYEDLNINTYKKIYKNSLNIIQNLIILALDLKSDNEFYIIKTGYLVDRIDSSQLDKIKFILDEGEKNNFIDIQVIISEFQRNCVR